ncbi:DUF3038 domain-containing protein [Synechococcus sp. PCC 7336]|uniref:DUF3038 domain-containing protein n=1 Tax=Synechococcus sp. PCC 7336 TaxID=195250 RepID=UPI00034DE4A0|nr:DUF3038 domain-containing protein [Synechococcus sp. PCC 7336]
MMSGESREGVAAALKALSLPDNRTGLEATTKAHLDFLLLAIEALCDEGSEVMLSAASALGLAETIGDRVTLWRLRNANPLRKSSGGRKKVDIEEVRALVLVAAYLARHNHTQIRTTMAKLEQCIAKEVSPLQEPSIADYLDAFHAGYRDRMADGDRRPQNSITELALTLLVELLFYGSQYGPQRLWNALLTRPELELPDGETEPEADAAPETAVPVTGDLPVSEI